MSEIKSGMLGLYGAEHSKFNHMTKLGFKGLHVRRCQQQYRLADINELNVAKR